MALIRLLRPDTRKETVYDFDLAVSLLVDLSRLALSR
jgi:hypothetical protein